MAKDPEVQHNVNKTMYAPNTAQLDFILPSVLYVEPEVIPNKSVKSK